MSFLDSFLLAVALALPAMTVVYGSVSHVPVRPVRGLAVATVVATCAALLLWLGLWLGHALRFDLPEVDRMVFLGVVGVLFLKTLPSALRRTPPSHPYDLSVRRNLALLPLATGVNVLLAGLGAGFLCDMEHGVWTSVVVLAVLSWLLIYLAVMLGRQKKAFHVRRWTLIALLFLLVFAVRLAFN